MADDSRATETFADVLAACAKSTEFVAEFDRLTGCRLSEVGQRSGIDRMIDEATGWEREQLRRFCWFVYETVWSTDGREAGA